MHDDDRVLDRRTVLRTAGATVGAAVAGTGVAAASSFQQGDCATFVADAWLHDRGCPHGDRLDLATTGTTATVYDTCTDDRGRGWVLVSLEHSQLAFGWVQDNALEHC